MTDPATADDRLRDHDEAAARRWLAASNPSAADLAPLLADAAGRGAGLCPACLADLIPLPPPPPPLAAGHGRLAGDGYAVAVGGGLLRRLVVRTPTRTLRNRPDSVDTRAVAAAAALPFVFGALLAAGATPTRVGSPVAAVTGLLSLAALAYSAVWLVRRPVPPDARAADAAWDVLARSLVERGRGTRLLTRLCRTSLGRGDPVERAGVLAELIDQAAGDDARESLHLLAAARTLQVDDAGRLGRDRVGGIAELAAEAFRGDRPLPFAEAVLETFLDQPSPPADGDRARLRALLIGAAFQAGLRPRDLLDLWAASAPLRRAMAVEPAHRLGLLHGVWRLRAARPWEKVGPADGVFDLARVAPNISGRLLAEYPDLLLAYRPEAVGEGLAPVLVCCRGVVVGGATAADPAAEVGVSKLPGGGFELVFGPHRVPTDRRPSEAFVEMVRGFLRFRADSLLPFIDRYREPGNPKRLAALLDPLRVRCTACGTVSAVTAGQVGVPLPDSPAPPTGEGTPSRSQTTG